MTEKILSKNIKELEAIERKIVSVAVSIHSFDRKKLLLVGKLEGCLSIILDVQKELKNEQDIKKR